MKIYHDHNEDGSWTEITDIKQYPVIPNRMDQTTQINFVLEDYQGALYATWETYNFIPLKITDGAGTPITIFRGFLTGKKYTHDQLSCIAHGLSVKLDWTPMHKNYIAAEGLISAIPSTHEFTVTFDMQPTGDAVPNQWTSTAGNHYDAIDVVAGELSVTDTGGADIEEFDVTDPGDYDGTIDSIDIRVFGNRSREGGAYPGNPTCDLYFKGAWKGAQAINLPQDTSAWVAVTFAGLGGTEADLEAMQFRLSSVAHTAIQHTAVSQMFLRVSFVGVKNTALDVTDDDGENFSGWAADQFVNDVDMGILIVDNTGNIDICNFEATANPVVTNGAYISGDKDSLDSVKDGLTYRFSDTTTPHDAYFTVAMGDAVGIPTSQHIHEIRINWRLALYKPWNLLSYTPTSKVKIKLYDGVDWDQSWTIIDEGNADGREWYVGGTLILTGTNSFLSGFLTDDAGDYKSLKGIRMYLEGWVLDLTDYLYVDQLTVDVYYAAVDVAPIMETISNNGASNGANWLVCDDAIFTDLELTVGDSFKIGSSTTQILADIFQKCKVDVELNTTTTKYIAQFYKGTYCKEILRKIKLLEGLHWWEDHANNRVVIAKQADFVDSAVDLTQANYLEEWEFEDDNNYYEAVEVYGCAAYGIYHRAVDENIDSPRTKTIIEETIMTWPEAKDVADSMLAEYKTKRPSIKIPLLGVNAALTVGTTATLTMVRPTVGEADYPIRMTERSKKGATIKTVVYFGLGHSTQEEKIADIINKAMYLAHKAHTDRLVSTPYAPNASITWNDVGGANAAVDSRIVVQNTNPAGTIDVAIDALIATHAATPHAVMTEAQLFEMEVIGSGNKVWKNCLYMDESTIAHQWECAGAILRNSYAGAGRDDYLHFETDLPMYKIVKGITYWLHINALKVYVDDADAGDYINQVFVQGNQADGGGTTTEINDVNPGVGATNITAAGEYDIDVTPFDCNNGGDPYIGLSFSLYCHTSGNRDLDPRWIKFEYYYATV